MTQDTQPVELSEKHIHVPTLQTIAHIEELQNPQQKSLNLLKDNDSLQKQEKTYNSAIRIYVKCILISMGSLFFGYSMSVLNLAQDQLNEVYDLKDNLEVYQGILASCLFVGAIAGSLIAGYLLANFGERKTSMICDVLVVILSLFFIIPNYAVAVIVRTLLGIIVGINASLVPSFLFQISPKELNGFTGCFVGVFISSGIFLGIVMGQGFPTDDDELEKKEDFWWRFVLMLPILFSVIRFLAITLIYRLETPFFYVAQGKQDLARKSLEQIYRKEFVEGELQVLNEQKKHMQQQQPTWTGIFNKDNRDLTFLGMNLFVTFQFTGIIAITFYSSTIFENATGDKDTGNVVNLIATGIFSITPFFGGELCKRFGRKPLMIFGKLILSIVLLFIGIFTFVYEESEGSSSVQDLCSVLNIILIFSYLISFNLTEGAAVWVIPAEILNGKQMSMCTATYNFTSFLVSLIFPIAESAFGIEPIFIFFALALIPSIIYENKRIKETKGLNRLEIEELYSKKKENQSNDQQSLKQQNPVGTDLNIQTVQDVPPTQPQ